MLAVAVALGARSAEAAVLLPELEAVLASEESGCSSTGCQSALPVDPIELPTPRPQYEERAQHVLPTVPASTAGATSVVAPGSSAPATLATAVHLDGSQLVTYLTRESRILLPVPFLSGVFRPPRVIG